MTRRDSYIDIIKGVGIISVVVGHAFYVASNTIDIAYIIKNFVYTYHLAIFFWVSGYLYKTKKLKDFAARIFANYKKYVAIALVSYVILPIWYYFDVIEAKTIHEIIYQFAHIFLFQVTRGVFTGPMWFVTWLTVAQIIYYCVDFAFRDRIKTKCIICLILGIFGIFLSFNESISHFYYLDRAFLMQPILLFGEVCKEHKKMTLRQAFILAPVSATLIIVLNIITGYNVELSHSELYGYWLFYPITWIGILFCLSISIIIENTNISKAVGYLGNISFIIMATHIMGFKLLDGIVGKMNSEISQEVLRRYPTSFDSLAFCCLYSVAGIVLPVLLSGAIQLLKRALKRSSENN